jgi:hypothetical protein
LVIPLEARDGEGMHLVLNRAYGSYVITGKRQQHGGGA